jgi:hypothetical protein
VLHEIRSTLIHVDVHVVPPGPHPFWFLFTVGMSALPMSIPAGLGVAPYAELSLLLPPSWRCDLSDPSSSWPVEWLQRLARFPHLNRTWFGHGHTVPNGHPPEPLGPGTKLACMLVGPSISVPALGPIGSGERAIEMFTLWPIHRDETRYKLARGACALFELFDRMHVSDVIDARRPSALARVSHVG